MRISGVTEGSMVPRYPRLLHDALTVSAARLPDKVAVIDGSRRITYGELNRKALDLAAALQRLGVARGDRVALYLENSLEVAIGIYAALFAGAAFVVINPQTKAHKLEYMLNDSGATAILSDGKLSAVTEQVADGLSARPRLIKVGDGTAKSLGLEQLSAEQGGEPALRNVIPNDLAGLVYTSGSTGNPKGVMLSHQNMVFTQGSLVEYLRLSESDRILNVLPLAFDYGLYQLLMTVHLGATLVLERTFAFPAAIVRRVIEEQVTVFPGVPTVFATLLSQHRKSPIAMPSVRRFTNTAAHLPDEYVPGLLEMSPEASVFKMYGLTECKRVCYLEPELVLSKPMSVGKAIPGTEVYVLDEDGNEVPAGQVGVLHVRGPHVMMGYWNLPNETAYMLVKGKYPGERVLCTHDYFRQDEDGFLYFVGRSDDIIKSRGEKVSPTEVENALAAIHGVSEVAVIGVPDDILGEAIRAYVVLDEGTEYTAQEFKREAMMRLEGYMVPSDVLFEKSLPKTATGKVRKKSLVEQVDTAGRFAASQDGPSLESQANG